MILSHLIIKFFDPAEDLCKAASSRSDIELSLIAELTTFYNVGMMCD